MVESSDCLRSAIYQQIIEVIIEVIKNVAQKEQNVRAKQELDCTDGIKDTIKHIFEGTFEVSEEEEVKKQCTFYNHFIIF